MKIDTTRLLLLTVLTSSIGLCAVITGCSSGDGEAAPPAHTDSANTTSPTAPAATTDGAPVMKPAGGSSSGGSSSGGTKDAGAGDSGHSDSGTTTAACLDDKSPAVQPACPTDGKGEECGQTCDDFALSWKKGLSADIRKCLTANICNTGTTASCADKALAKACPDATATTFCTPMVTGCKSANPADTITQASCETLVKGLNAAGRDVLKSCFESEFVCGDCLAKMK